MLKPRLLRVLRLLPIRQQGDVIMEVNRRPARNTKEYEEMTSQLKKDQTALLLVNRGGRSLFLALRPSS